MKRTTIIETVIFLYIILFLYTGISKLMDFTVFREQISESPILKPFATTVAWGLPWIEFSITALLIIPRWRLKGLYASMVLMIAFTSYITGILLFDKDLPCSCGGILQQLSWPQHLVFNMVFILLSIWGIVLQKREKKERKMNWNINGYGLMGNRSFGEGN